MNWLSLIIHLLVGALGANMLWRTLSCWAALRSHSKALGPVRFKALIDAQNNIVYLMHDALSLNFTCVVLLIAILILI